MRRLNRRLFHRALLGFAALLAMASSSCGEALEGPDQEVLFLRHKGADMNVWVRGNIDSKVIILVVHGGAGGNSAAYVPDYKDNLEHDYAIAYWDQRHGGSAQGSFSKKDFNHTNAWALMAEDMMLVIKMLRTRYGQDTKVFAWGHSWGVQLGTKFLVDHDPELLDGWIASNGTHSGDIEHAARNAYILTYAQQMVDEGAELSEAVTRGDANIQTPQDAIDWVNANDPITEWDQTDVQWTLGGVIGDWVYSRYTDPDYTENLPPGALLFSSPVSPIAQGINSARTGTLINNSYRETSIQEFWDLSTEMKHITIPVALLWGKYDHIIPEGVAYSYRDSIGTPPEDIMFEFYDAGHSPEYEQPDAFAEDVRAFIEQHR
jgi:pimeloyl-ACP methyl ester carboxylesterase